MRMSMFAGLAATLFLGACATTETTTQVSMSGPFMLSGQAVEAPRGYTDMCNIRPQICREMAPTQYAEASPPAASASLLQTVSYNTSSVAGLDAYDAAMLRPAMAYNALANAAFQRAKPVEAASATSGLTTPERMKMLKQVNRTVNGAVRAISDQALYGVDELWNRPGVGKGASGDCEDFAIEKREQLIEQGYPARDLFFAVAFRADLGMHAVLVAHTEAGDYVLDNRTPYVTPWNQVPYVWVKRQSRDDAQLWSLVDELPRQPARLQVAALSPEFAAQAAGGR